MFQPKQGPLYDYTIGNTKNLTSHPNSSLPHVPNGFLYLYKIMENVPFRSYFILAIIFITH